MDIIRFHVNKDSLERISSPKGSLVRLIRRMSVVSSPDLVSQNGGPPRIRPDQSGRSKRPKLTGRAFYESLGSPKMILAPMVDQSEFVGISLAPRISTGTDIGSRRGECLLGRTSNQRIPAQCSRTHQ